MNWQGQNQPPGVLGLFAVASKQVLRDYMRNNPGVQLTQQQLQGIAPIWDIQVFNVNDFIVTYYGDNYAPQTNQAIYGNAQQVYSKRKADGNIEDAACRRSIGAFIQHNRNDNNVEIVHCSKTSNPPIPRPQQNERFECVKATRNIYHGEELLADFGPNYQYNGIRFRTKRIYKPRNQRGVGHLGNDHRLQWYRESLPNMLANQPVQADAGPRDRVQVPGQPRNPYAQVPNV